MTQPSPRTSSHFTEHREQPFSSLPRDMVPRRHAAETSDVRKESLSQSEARDKLADWIVYRFEKVKNSGELDDNGYPVKPSWDHVRRHQIQGLSKREISKLVRNLDKKTLPAPAKKAGLSEPIQRQLDKALDHLMQSEYDPRYHYVLAQLDCELRQRDPSEDSENRQSRERRSSSSRRKSKSRKSKSKTRKTYERVSVTGYFKRIPRREEDAVSMYQMYHHKRQSPVEHQVHWDQPLVTRPRRASISDPTILHRAAQQAPSSHHQEHQGRRPTHLLPVPILTRHGPDSPRDGNEVQVIRESPRTSQSSFTEDELTGGSDNELTPQSSVDGSPMRRHHRHTRFRSRSRSRDRPRPPPRSRSSSPVPYGVESPRQHGRHDDNYVWTSVPGKLPHAPSPPEAKPRTAPMDIRRTEDLDKLYKPSRVDVRRVTESWERGRRHEDDLREDTARHQDRGRGRRRRSDVETEVQEPSSKHKHPSPPLSQPSHVNRRRASVRIIAPEDYENDTRDGDRDVERHFERLRIDEERHPHRSREARDHDRRSRRSVDYTARHPDEIFHMEDHMSWDERAPRDYRRRASLSDTDRNPFAGRSSSHRAGEYR